MDQQFIIDLYDRILFREPTQGEIDTAVIVLGESGESGLESSLSSSDGPSSPNLCRKMKMMNGPELHFL